MPSDLAGRPPAGTAIPAIAYELAEGDDVESVWLNTRGGLTMRIGRRYLKWSPPGAPDLTAERVRLEWAGRYVTVPRVLAYGDDGGAHWLLTEAIDGRTAVDPIWKAAPERAARSIGRGLRHLHDTFPVDACPFDWSPQVRAPDDVLGTLGATPSIDRLVVCHGDACAPNTILAEDGDFAGHVDFGSLGVADRWADLAVGTWSLEWNFGSDLSAVLLAAYGIDADWERIDYYRRLWDLEP
jgi:kanamycin kinase